MWTIRETSYEFLMDHERDQMWEIEQSCKNDPTPIIGDRKTFDKYHSSSEVIFLLKRNEHVAGYATLEKEENNVWYLQNLAVLKKYRGIGWGKVLINLRNNYAIERGAVLLYRHSGVNNVPANKIYEKLGFVYEEYINNHYGQGEHAYKMSKQLKEDRQ